ncbi:MULTISPECIES: hypothetical protein [unclassified Oceanispirochaeta]|uniref:hypothetical protein n=1 Tax=unclassified Oceanispirochaeta TaxID=2635722 RepID=UPI0011C027CC|nr:MULTISPECIES: hypothetical protein [unclassified Oceanispirochaeta]MBF9016379.1 hypothetical protein [Oceanispirochaeta sp. M2]NPD72841.1 hypothetical protein [Oceanispirochaeta sp. M1]
MKSETYYHTKYISEIILFGLNCGMKIMFNLNMKRINSFQAYSFLPVIPRKKTQNGSADITERLIWFVNNFSRRILAS